MSDLISRRAVLKHIEKIRYAAQMMDDTRRASILMNGMHLCEEAVRNQTSAEHEIIRCRDCKHWYKDADSGMSCEYTEMSQPEDGFCNWAERRGEEDEID